MTGSAGLRSRLFGRGVWDWEGRGGFEMRPWGACPWLGFFLLRFVWFDEVFRALLDVWAQR